MHGENKQAHKTEQKARLLQDTWSEAISRQEDDQQGVSKTSKRMASW